MITLPLSESQAVAMLALLSANVDAILTGDLDVRVGPEGQAIVDVCLPGGSTVGVDVPAILAIRASLVDLGVGLGLE